jgi:hypothetical protein
MPRGFRSSARLLNENLAGQNDEMEMEEVREHLKAAEIALSEATKVDQLARAKALRTGRVASYLCGPEARALAKAREEFSMWASFLAFGTAPRQR